MVESFIKILSCCAVPKKLWYKNLKFANVFTKVSSQPFPSISPHHEVFMLRRIVLFSHLNLYTNTPSYLFLLVIFSAFSLMPAFCFSHFFHFSL